MKRILTALCMLLVGGMAQAASRLTLNDVQGHPGDEAEVALGLASTDAVTAMEVCIPLEAALHYVEGSATLNAERTNGHSIQAAEVDDTLRIYVYSLSRQLLKEGDGTLLTFRLKLGKEPAAYTLQPMAVLSDVDGQPVANVTAQGSTLTLLAPKLSLPNGHALDLGHNPIRSTYTYDIPVSNTGTEPLVLSSITAGDEVLTVSTALPLTIRAGATDQVQVSYSPVKWGSHATTLTLESNAVNTPRQTIRVTGDPYSVNEVHVGNTHGTGDEEVQLTVSMNNMEPIVAGQMNLRLPRELEYVEGSATLHADRTNGHSLLATRNGDTLKLVFYATNNAPLRGEDGTLLSVRLRLKGNGYYPVDVHDVVLSNIDMADMTSATTNGYVTISSPTISSSDRATMPAHPVTEAGSTTYHIYNSGSAPLTVERATFLAEGWAVSTPLPLTIRAGESSPLEVTHRSATEGTYTTTMQLYCNDPYRRMKSVAVSTEAYEPNTLGLTQERQAGGDSKVKVSLSNYSSIVAVQFDLQVTGNAPLSNENLTVSERLSNHSATVTKMAEGKYRVLVYSMVNAPISGNEGEILAFTLSADRNTLATIAIGNIVLSTTDGSDKSSAEDSSIETEFGMMRGDVNNDGEVDVLDLSTLCSTLLGNNPNPYNPYAADMDQDGEVDVLDLSQLVELILKGDTL